MMTALPSLGSFGSISSRSCSSRSARSASASDNSVRSICLSVSDASTSNSRAASASAERSRWARRHSTTGVRSLYRFDTRRNAARSACTSGSLRLTSSEMNSSSKDASRSNTDGAGYGLSRRERPAIGSASSAADVEQDRHRVARRHDDPGRLARSPSAGVGGEGHEIEIDPGADHQRRRQPSIDRVATHGCGSFTLVARQRRRQSPRCARRRSDRDHRSAGRAGRAPGRGGSADADRHRARRCGATVATTFASASTVGTSPCNIWNASRSC